MVLFLIGLASGIISGMGIGGGAILIPALVSLSSGPTHCPKCEPFIFYTDGGNSPYCTYKE